MPPEDAVSTVGNIAPSLPPGAGLPPDAVVSRETIPDRPVEDAPHWEEAADADMKAIWAKRNPEREPDGKFKGKEAGEISPADGKTPINSKPDADKSGGEISPDQPKTEAKEPSETAIPVPQSWSAEVKERWASLPPDLQTYIAKRESEAHQAITRYGTELKAYEPLKAVIEQHKDVFECNGVTPDDGISRLLAAERLLEENAPAAIAQIAQAYGVDLRRFGGNPQNPNSEVEVLHREIAGLKRQLMDTSNRIETRERSETETKLQSLNQLVEKFSKDKADWSDLENDILAEITGLNAAQSQGLMAQMTPDEMLTKAYERAQRNNPEIWAKRQAAEAKAAEARRIEEAKKRAEDAKKANAVNVNSSPANGKSIKTIDEDLKAIYRKLNA